MTLTVDNISEPINIKGVDITIIQNKLKSLDGRITSFLILTDPESNSFIQCAGNTERLTVEQREFNKNEFRHFVIGKNVENTTLEWTQINCKVGPINIQSNEALNVSDAYALFAIFLNRYEIPDNYIKRDVTEQFTE